MPPSLTEPDQRLCFSTLGCPDLSLSQAAKLGAEYGFGLLELRCLQGLIIEPEHFQKVLPDPMAVRSSLEKSNQSVRILSTSIRVFAPPEDAIATLEKFARWGDDLGATHLRLFDGGKVGESPTPEQWTAATRLVEQWQVLRDQKGFKIRLGIETHWAVTSAATASEFVQRFPNVSIIWDTHHTWKAGETLGEFWQAADNSIVHLHVKDSKTNPLATKGWSSCPPGEGEFPWMNLTEILDDAGYQGAISLEWEKYWEPSLPSLDQAMHAFRTNWGMI